MPPTLPSQTARFVTLVARGALAAWIAFTAACQRAAPPVAPGEPIPPPAELTLGTMDEECDGLIAALAAYKACPNLDEDDRYDLDAWSERAQQDFAAGKKAQPTRSARSPRRATRR